MPNFRKTLVILALAAAVGCSRGPKVEPWYVEQISISNASSGDGLSPVLANEELREELLRAFSASDRFRPLPEGERPRSKAAPLSCRLEVVFAGVTSKAEEGNQTLRAEVGVVLELKRSGEFDSYQATGFGNQALSGRAEDGRKEAFRVALGLALFQAVESQSLQLAALEKTDQALIADLKSADPRVRDYAVRGLADRKNAAAVPALIERLADDNREVSMRAVGALGAIGDPSAVPALIDFAQRGDSTLLIPLVEVIATIGGRDAEGYLFTLANGHPELVVRRAAEEAQQRLQTTPGAPEP